MAFISEIKAGNFNIRLRLRTTSGSINAFGETPKVYGNSNFVFWANKNVKSLRNINEKWEGDQLQSYGNFFFQARYDSDWVNTVKPFDRLKNEDSPNETYEILSYIIDPRKEYIEFYARLDID
tara:strand:- start:168 stop:536 length:369 start_codon:yes stop_codon:yes gene_type:complete